MSKLRERVVGAAAVCAVLVAAARVIAPFGTPAHNAPEEELVEISQRPAPPSTSRPGDSAQTSATGDSPSNRLSPPKCRSSKEAFVPAMVSIAQVTSDANVLAVHRGASDTPGVPPVSESGKQDFAWDAGGAKPGSSYCNVNLNAHTWPDGTALGNALLRDLSTGDVIVVHGAAGERQCYRVTGQRRVAIAHVPQAVLDRFFDDAGSPELTVLACSGRRLGPGHWTHRTLWYATPVWSVGDEAMSPNG